MPIKPLNKMKPHEKGIIVKVKSGKAMQGVHRRILDMGVVSGTPVDVQRVAPMGDPIEIKIKGYNLTLRKEEAANIYVEITREVP